MLLKHFIINFSPAYAIGALDIAPSAFFRVDRNAYHKPGTRADLY
jgi:hypothetical protein